MTIDPSVQAEKEDLKRRQDLQAQLQEAIRRSAPASEIKRIQHEIEESNRKIASYTSHIKRPTNP